MVGFLAEYHELLLLYRRLKLQFSKMATGRSLPVILKKFDQNFDPIVLKAAEVSRKCRVLATLSSDCTLELWNLKSDASCSLPNVTQ